MQLGYFTMSVVVHDTDEGQVEAKAAQHCDYYQPIRLYRDQGNRQR